MIHVVLLFKGAQKTSRQRDSGKAIAEGDQYRKQWFKEQREAGKEML